VLCRPASEPAIEVLSLRVALAAASVIEAHAGNVALELKWPNDLMLDGLKLGGILCEAHWQGETAWVGVGLGINLANSIPADLSTRAVALSRYAPAVIPETIAPDLVAAIVAASQIDRGLSSAEVAEFGGRDWLLGKAIAEPVQGLADGISKEGLLRVRDQEGRHHLVRAGEVVVAGM
jgi:BirA family biotin operon repressor/biotin-[acetyl-CoA-carboxylase] ligase